MNKYDKIFKYAIGVLFIAFLGIIVFLNLIVSNKVFSENENRMLEQMPKFSFGELFHGKYTTNFEKHIADQFAFRDTYIEVKTDFQKFMGNNESNGVYICSDGSLIENFKKPSDKDFNDRIDTLNSFSKSLPQVNKFLMIVPTSAEILKSKLPAYAPSDDELIYINKMKKSIDKDVKFVDVVSSLNEKNKEYIFYRTDHHWTTKGAYYAYKNLAETMNYTPLDEPNFDIKKVTDEFYGSLYSKSGYKHVKPDSIELYLPKVENDSVVEYADNNKIENSLYNMENLKKKDKYTVFLNGNHSLVKITTNNNSNNKLLLIRDSFANSIAPFLTLHYSEIYLVDLRYYNDDLVELVKKNEIKDVLILYNVSTFFQDSSVLNLAN